MIFVDLDGVLCDFYKAFTAIIAQRHVVPVLSSRDVVVWSEGLSPAQIDYGWRTVEASPDFWENLEPLAPPSVFRRLAAAHKDVPILFVTSREVGGDGAWSQSIRWLEKMGIREPLVIRHVGRGRKGELVPIWSPIDMAIEDDPRQALAYARAGVEVALMDWPYTVGVTHPNIHRCNIIEALSLAGVPE